MSSSSFGVLSEARACFSEMSTKAYERSALLYQIDHVFLPPKLPQQDDFTVSNDRALLGHILGALHCFKDHVGQEHHPDVQRAVGMICAMLRCRPELNLDEAQVLAALEGLEDQGEYYRLSPPLDYHTFRFSPINGRIMLIHFIDVLFFQLTGQNFGILITRQDQTVFFEQFELLSRNSAVMSCQGRLQRSFPSTCISMRYSRYTECGFIPALAQCLTRLDNSTHPSSRPKSQKQGERDEERDTIDPRLSSFLNGFLRGLGAVSQVVQIEKRSPEDVLWNNARLPWHRSATWLSVRVALHLIWSRKHKMHSSNLLFKGFMAFFIGSCVIEAQDLEVPDDLLYGMLAKLIRRCLKISQSCHFGINKPSWVEYCSVANTTAIQYLEKRWSYIHQSCEHHLPLDELKTLSFSADSAISIPALSSHLSQVKTAEAVPSSSDDYRMSYAFSRTKDLELPSTSFEEHHTFLSLAEIEMWIATNLTSWLNINIRNEKTCG